VQVMWIANKIKQRYSETTRKNKSRIIHMDYVSPPSTEVYCCIDCKFPAYFPIQVNTVQFLRRPVHKKTDLFEAKYQISHQIIELLSIYIQIIILINLTIRLY